MRVKVRWFKQSGKFYTDTKVDYDVLYFHQAVARFIDDLDKGIRPGLVDSLENEFHALLKVYTGSGPVMHLIITKEK